MTTTLPAGSGESTGSGRSAGSAPSARSVTVRAVRSAGSVLLAVAARKALAVGAGLGAGLIVVDLLSLWFAPPPSGLLGTALWCLVAGAGLVASAIPVLAFDQVLAAEPPRAWVSGELDVAASPREPVSGQPVSGQPVSGHLASPERPSREPASPAAARVGRLMLAAGALLLVLPLATALGFDRAGQTAAVAAVAVLVPWALLLVVEPVRAVAAQRTLRAAILVAGVVAVVAAVPPWWPVTESAALVEAVLLFCAGWVQFELSGGDERRQVLWLISGTLAAVFLDTVSLVPENAAIPVPFGVLLGAISLVLPVTLAIATVAPRAFDVRAVISRTVLVVVMLTVVLAVFAALDGVIRAVHGGQPVVGVLGLLAALVAAGYHPVLVRARATLDELLFGGRADPVDTLTRLGNELSAGSSPQEWLDTLRAALAVPALELRRDGEVLARSGSAGPADDRMTAVTPLRVGAEPVGELVVTLPADQLRLPPTTRAVLTLVAGPLAQALHAVRLTEQLQASRGRVVAALEEERRRVRRDLHDGLGPTLTGIAYSADAVTNLVGTDPERAAEVLSGLRLDATDAIAEVRRIVYGLRPRALDELGLVNAVRQRLDRLHAADGRPLTVEITAPGELPPLPAAVEVVAYRVAVEAVTNVARHAGVPAATVRFALPEPANELKIEVTDDGPAAAGWVAGVGLESMRERVEQLGGTLEVGPTPHGGRVRASVPLVVPD